MKGLEVYGKEKVVGENEVMVNNRNGPSSWTQIIKKNLKARLGKTKVVVHVSKIANFQLEK
jgi:hypothetical protein